MSKRSYLNTPAIYLPNKTNNMKKISVIVPCYNEENSIHDVYHRVKAVFQNELPGYDYDIIYVDDASPDHTEKAIREVCFLDPQHCKAVFNATNFGFHRNVFASFSYADGDAAFLMFGDLQDPPENIPSFVAKWEEGYKVVVGVRNSSDDNAFMRFARKSYYRIINILAQKKQLENMDGYGLYDREFLSAIRGIEEVAPYLKAVIDEYGMNVTTISYSQNKGARGKSNFNFWRNYDFAMHGITSYTKMLMRIATFVGLIVGIFSLVYAAYVFIRKLLFWDSYPLGIAQIMVALLLLGSIQIFFIGILGEYILTINERAAKKPRVIIAETINLRNDFDPGKTS